MTVFDNKVYYSSFISTLANEIILENSSFEKILSLGNGACFISEVLSLIIVKNSVFIRNSANQGGVFYANRDGEIRF